MKNKKIKIFLASSGELKDEREKFELFISRENKKYINDNIFLELIVWEDLKASFNGERIQDYFNNELLKCEIVIALFGIKVGQFTEEEFDIAYEAFKLGKNPKYLYVYFKDVKISINDITTETLKINGLKEKIQKFEQMYNSYNSIDNLIFQLKLQLDKIIPEIIPKNNNKLFSNSFKGVNTNGHSQINIANNNSTVKGIQNNYISLNEVYSSDDIIMIISTFLDKKIRNSDENSILLKFDFLSRKLNISKADIIKYIDIAVEESSFNIEIKRKSDNMILIEKEILIGHYSL